MKCEICHKGPAEGLTVYRVNEKGVKGIWRCRAHVTMEQADKFDPETVRIVNIIDPPNRQHEDGAAGDRRMANES